jgi:hypothetical protein
VRRFADRWRCEDRRERQDDDHRSPLVALLARSLCFDNDHYKLAGVAGKLLSSR